MELPSLTNHTVAIPLHVNVVPGDQAAGRIPDAVVRTKLLYQRVQQAKRRASSHLSSGDTDSAFDVYERANGTTTTRLSVGASGGNAATDASFAGASLDGLRVLIETTESLVVTDSDALNDVYERFLNTTTTPSGAGPTAAFDS